MFRMIFLYRIIGSVETIERLCKILFPGIKVPFEFESEFYENVLIFVSIPTPCGGSPGRPGLALAGRED
jgi:hypothetical protein